MRFMLGESMGRAVVLLLHRKKPEFWDGAILVTPMYKVRENPLCYKGRPRMKTAYELIRISNDLEKRLQEFSLPFVVLHGNGDKVIDKAVSQELYEVALSADKTFKLYHGVWHGLLVGETQENVEIVFADVIGWLGKRADCGNCRFESELKHKNDGSHL